MTKVEEKELAVFIAYHGSVQNDILTRVTLRENSLMIFLGAIAALGAAAIQAKDPTFLLIIPYLTIGILFIIVHHNQLISGLVLYRELELNKYLKENGIKLNHWDSSANRLRISRDSRIQRFWGDFGLIIGPSIISIAINYTHLFTTLVFSILTISSIICILLSISLLFKINLIRKNTFQQIESAVNSQQNTVSTM